MPLSGPLKPWTYYRSPNFPYIHKAGPKNLLIVYTDDSGAYGFLMNTDRTGQPMKARGKIQFSPFVTQRAKRNPAFLKCQAVLTEEIQPDLRRKSFIACDRLFRRLPAEIFDRELFSATDEAIRIVLRAIQECPVLSEEDKDRILSFAISQGYTRGS